MQTDANLSSGRVAREPNLISAHASAAAPLTLRGQLGQLGHSDTRTLGRAHRRAGVSGEPKLVAASDSSPHAISWPAKVAGRKIARVRSGAR